MRESSADITLRAGYVTLAVSTRRDRIDPADRRVASFVLMDIRCPLCRSAIGLEDINVSTDIALCRSCGKTFQFSEISGGGAASVPDLATPPAGAWFEQIPGGFRVGGSTRSWLALFIVPFTCVWAGGSLSGIYGKQILSGHFDVTTSMFGLPFLIGSIFLIGLCAMTVAGKVEVAQNGDRLSVFIGVGWLGWTRNYLASDFSSVREDRGLTGFNFNQRAMVVVLEGKRRAAFGSMLSEERRYFVLSALRKMFNSANRIQASPITRPIFR
jgi:hypothetical protein